jgi:hypothetical protein
LKYTVKGKNAPELGFVGFEDYRIIGLKYDFIIHRMITSYYSYFMNLRNCKRQIPLTLPFSKGEIRTALHL